MPRAWSRARRTPEPVRSRMAAAIRIGTCSWADESLTKYFYPGIKGAEERLRYTPTFRRGRGELDLLPAPGRAHGAPLGRADARGLRDAREGLRGDDAPPGEGRAAAARPARGGAARLARARRTSVARVPGRGLPPLPRGAGAAAGGGQARRDPDAAAALRRLQALLARVPRVGSGPARRGRDAGRVPARELARRGEPRRDVRLPGAPPHDLRDRRRAADGGPQRPPTVVATTSPTAYVRFHGRNASTWNKRTGSAAERFDYLYSEEELREWVGPLGELSGQAENVYAMFNNNGRSTMPGLPTLENPAEEARSPAPVNAQMLRQLLEREGLPVTPAPAAA